VADDRVTCAGTVGSEVGVWTTASAERPRQAKKLLESGIVETNRKRLETVGICGAGAGVCALRVLASCS
jgi:hypothetical protein